MDKIIESLESRNFGTTLSLCSEFELQLHEREINRDIPPFFFSVYLIVFLIVGDLSGAKFLWKRIPSQFKSNAYRIVDIWNIGKLLWGEDVPGALIALKTDWPSNIANYVRTLEESLKNQQLETCSIAYSVVPLITVAASLSMTAEDILPLLLSLDWRVDLAQGLVYPRRQASAATEGAVSKLHENLEVMERLGAYASELERSTLKVDVSVKL